MAVNLPYIYCCQGYQYDIALNRLFLVEFQPFIQLNYRRKGNLYEAAQCKICGRLKLRGRISRVYGHDIPEGLDYVAYRDRSIL